MRWHDESPRKPVRHRARPLLTNMHEMIRQAGGRGPRNQRGPGHPLLACGASHPAGYPRRKTQGLRRANCRRIGATIGAGVWARLRQQEPAPNDSVRRGFSRRSNCRLTAATIGLDAFQGHHPDRRPAATRFLRRDVPHGKLEHPHAGEENRRDAFRAHAIWKKPDKLIRQELAALRTRTSFARPGSFAIRTCWIFCNCTTPMRRTISKQQFCAKSNRSFSNWAGILLRRPAEADANRR